MKKLLLIMLTLILATANTIAETSLYSAEVVVASQSEQDRTEAVPEAMIRVLQKLSGQRDMPNSEALDEALYDADSFLLSFNYKNVERTDADGQIESELRLVASFMQPEIDRVVQQVGLPRWQQQRPPVQIWAIIDDGRGRQLKPLEYEYVWTAMEDVAVVRGLPVVWPELDEEQLQLIDTSLLWGGYTDYLVEHGSPADGVVIVAARREGPEWTLRWNLAAGGHHWSWRSSDPELMYGMVAGIHQMTDHFASVNAIAASEQLQWSVELSVGELHGAQDYANCLAYLQQISLVTAVDIVSAAPGQVSFYLQLNASPEFLDEALGRGSVLIPALSGVEYDYRFLRE